MTLETIANLATSAATFVAVVALFLELRKASEERRLTLFFHYLDHYATLIQQRREKWRNIRDTLRKNEKTRHEVGDRVSSLDYLLMRTRQAEPLFPVEHEVIDNEVRSLNILNELCRLAEGDDHRVTLVGSLFAGDISYYQNRLADLLALHKRESAQRLFPITRHDALTRFPVANFYQTPPDANLP